MVNVLLKACLRKFGLSLLLAATNSKFQSCSFLLRPLHLPGVFVKAAYTFWAQQSVSVHSVLAFLVQTSSLGLRKLTAIEFSLGD